jgi:hypothetical protein
MPDDALNLKGRKCQAANCRHKAETVRGMIQPATSRDGKSRVYTYAGQVDYFCLAHAHDVDARMTPDASGQEYQGEGYDA